MAENERENSTSQPVVSIRELQRRRGEDQLRQALLELEMADAERAWSEPVPAEAQALFEETLPEMQIWIRREMETQRRPKFPWKAVRRAASVAAAVISVLAIGTVTAFAASESFRQQLMKFVVEFTPISVELSMEPLEDYMEVPEGYMGEYFISYIPEGFELYKAGEDWADYRTADDRWLSFNEMDANGVASYDSENADISYVQAFGTDVLVMEKNEHVICIWAFTDRYFSISLDGTKEEALRILNSLTHILH